MLLAHAAVVKNSKIAASLSVGCRGLCSNEQPAKAASHQLRSNPTPNNGQCKMKGAQVMGRKPSQARRKPGIDGKRDGTHRQGVAY